ncbi:MAG: Peptide deformylase [Candidatus Saccharibacteria bacterium]|nr:Peptide deformylase [Candidatus Saccharibacteria bacterium]
MLLKIYQTGQPVLRNNSNKVSIDKLNKKETQQLIDLMIETLRDSPGVGLAAPQVGEPLRILIVEDLAKYHEQIPIDVLKSQERKPVKLKVFVNPELEVIEQEEALFFEGCLSVDGYVAAVPRAKTVKIDAVDRYGKPISYTAKGWFARILQHEYDHLNGTLMIDRMKTNSFMNQKNFNSLWRKALPSKIKKEFGNQ